jgi:hypothetical protein
MLRAHSRFTNASPNEADAGGNGHLAGAFVIAGVLVETFGLPRDFLAIGVDIPGYTG